MCQSGFACHDLRFRRRLCFTSDLYFVWRHSDMLLVVRDRKCQQGVTWSPLLSLDFKFASSLKNNLSVQLPCFSMLYATYYKFCLPLRNRFTIEEDFLLFLAWMTFSSFLANGLELITSCFSLPRTIPHREHPVLNTKTKAARNFKFA